MAPSQRTLTNVVVLLLVAALAVEGLRPVPPFLLGVAMGSGLLLGFIPQANWWQLALRVVVGVVPTTSVVTSRFKEADIITFMAALGECMLVVLALSGAVLLLNRLRSWS
jgi:hypothetical protein